MKHTRNPFWFYPEPFFLRVQAYSTTADFGSMDLPLRLRTIGREYSGTNLCSFEREISRLQANNYIVLYSLTHSLCLHLSPYFHGIMNAQSMISELCYSHNVVITNGQWGENPNNTSWLHSPLEDTIVHHPQIIQSIFISDLNELRLQHNTSGAYNNPPYWTWKIECFVNADFTILAQWNLRSCQPRPRS